MNGNHATPPPAPGPLCAAYAPLVPLLESTLLTDDEATSVREHLATCAWCREEIGVYAVVDDALRRHYGSAQTGHFLNLEDIMRDADHLTDDAPTPPSFPTVTAPPPPSASSRGLSRMSPRMLAVMAGMAAVLLIALFAGVFAALQAGRDTTKTITQPTASIAPTAPTISTATAAPTATSAPTATATTVPTATPKPTPVSLANVNVYLDTYPQVTALNAGDSSVRWQVSLPSGVALGTASVNGIVMYMTDAAPGVKIGVHGLRASDGTEIWYNDLGGQRANVSTVSGGTLYVETNATWHAIDPTTGATRWSYSLPRGVVAAPLFADGIMYALTYDGTISTLSAIRISDGTLIKSVPGLGWPIAAANGLVYTVTYPEGLPGTNDLTATRSSDWSQAWREQAPINAVATLQGGIIYGAAGPNGERITAVDALTGQVHWTSEPGSTSAVGAEVTTIAVQDNTVYAHHRDGTIWTLDPATGAQRWKTVIFDSIANAPLLLAGGYIFTTGAPYGADHTFVVALNAQDGSELWRYQANTFLQTLDVGTQ